MGSSSQLWSCARRAMLTITMNYFTARRALRWSSRCASAPASSSSRHRSRLRRHPAAPAIPCLVQRGEVRAAQQVVVMAAVNASPAPMVSATLTGMPGCSCQASRVTSRLPAPPRVTATILQRGKLLEQAAPRPTAARPGACGSNACRPSSPSTSGTSASFIFITVASSSDSCTTSLE